MGCGRFGEVRIQFSSSDDALDRSDSHAHAAADSLVGPVGRCRWAIRPNSNSCEDRVRDVTLFEARLDRYRDRDCLLRCPSVDQIANVSAGADQLIAITVVRVVHAAFLEQIQKGRVRGRFSRARLRARESNRPNKRATDHDRGDGCLHARIVAFAVGGGGKGRKRRRLPPVTEGRLAHHTW